MFIWIGTAFLCSLVAFPAIRAFVFYLKKRFNPNPTRIPNPKEVALSLHFDYTPGPISLEHSRRVGGMSRIWDFIIWVPSAETIYLKVYQGPRYEFESDEMTYDYQ